MITIGYYYRKGIKFIKRMTKSNNSQTIPLINADTTTTTTPNTSSSSKPQADPGLWNARAMTVLLGWYAVSIVTLFVNKHILATIKFDPTALSLIQMTVTALLSVVNMYWACGMTSPTPHATLKDTKAVNKPRGFFKNMGIVGVFRFLTVFLGLVALQYVPVSFTETVKSSAPLFTVAISSVVLGDRNGMYVQASLIPIMLGLALCSAYEMQFNMIGFLAALSTNLAECCQFVYSKLLISGSKFKTSPIEFQLYTSLAAILILIPTCIIMVDFEATIALLMNDRTLVICALTSAVAYHFQTMLAWLLMSYVSPVTHSVSNVVKRAMLIWLSVLWFGNPVTVIGSIGTFVVIGGVLLYNKAKEYETSLLVTTSSDSSLPIKHI